MSIKHLTFKEYVNSKSILLNGLNKDPIAVTEYVVSKYCKISLGESLLDKEVLSLKPDDILSIKWNYANTDNPKCLSITTESKTFISYWKSAKIKTWLNKNTKE